MVCEMLRLWKVKRTLDNIQDYCAVLLKMARLSRRALGAYQVRLWTSVPSRYLRTKFSLTFYFG